MNITVSSRTPIHHEILVRANDLTFGTVVQATRPPTEEEALNIFITQGKSFWIDASSEDDYAI